MSEVDIDLDALRAQRIEAMGGHRTIRFGGRVFKIAAEFPWSWREVYEKNDSVLVARVVLGDQFDDFVALDPSDEDLRAFGREILTIYGLGPGESPASTDSSQSNGDRSRRTSNGSTARTSAKSSGAKKRSGSAGSSS